MESVHLVGVFPVGPEHFLCALLQRPSNGRFIPVWIPPFEGGQLAARLEGWSPNRPRMTEVFADALRESGNWVEAVEISSYVDGTFMATATLVNGNEVDMRASDALLLACEIECELGIDEMVASQASIYISPEDVRDFFGEDAMVDTPGEGGALSASGDAQADRDFEELMRNLGVEDISLEGQPDSGDEDSKLEAGDDDGDDVTGGEN
ncbi:hypothetical protein A0K93_07060 [Corynebacterium sp. BCW_4722]|nr:hypothetical protein A0K93_07060 [Corynebacterium sp. BCW_4722]